MTRSPEKYEVAVVGGGMVGSTLACMLAQGGIKTAVIEGRAPVREWPADSVDLRVSALTMTSRTILDALGVWDSISQSGIGPFRYMKVWDAAYGGELFFDGADVGYDILGYIVENRVSVRALWNALENLSDVSFFCPANVTGILSGRKEARIFLEDGQSISSQLVVAADGTQSSVRSMADIDVKGWSYEQTALVATVESTIAHNETAFQRFLNEGPLAFLPLGNGQSSIVWTSSTESTKRITELPENEFIDELENASGGILGNLRLMSTRASFPLKLQYAKNYFRDNVVLVGDSAHSVHPLAGQGANMGILDAAALAELVLHARAVGLSIAGSHILRKYERWRKGDNMAMMMGMDSLNRIFGYELPGLGQLRSLGMNIINREMHLKNFFNRYAMGLRGDLPSLAYGKTCW